MTAPGKRTDSLREYALPIARAGVPGPAEAATPRPPGRHRQHRPDTHAIRTHGRRLTWQPYRRTTNPVLDGPPLPAFSRYSNSHPGERSDPPRGSFNAGRSGTPSSSMRSPGRSIVPHGRLCDTAFPPRRILQSYVHISTNRCCAYRRGRVEYGYRSLTPAVAGVELPQPARRPGRPEPDDAFPGGATDDRPEPLLGPDDSGCCGRCWFCRCSCVGAWAGSARRIGVTSHFLRRCEGLR